ncbi:MAG: EAL domain-containing protein [Pseudomonadota bacterium]
MSQLCLFVNDAVFAWAPGQASVPWVFNLLGMPLPQEYWIALAIVFSTLSLLGLLARAHLRKHPSLFLPWRNKLNLVNVINDERLLKFITQNTFDGIVITQMDGRILWANKAYCKIMGWPIEEVLGRKPQEFCYPPDLEMSPEQVEAFHFTPDHPDLGRVARYENMRRNGERFWHELTSKLVEPSPGVFLVVIVGRDVTRQVAYEQKLERALDDLEYAATHDALTGLADRRMLLAFTDGLLSRRDTGQHGIGLLHIDLNHFKVINDRYGHAAGDALLIHVADAIRSTIRQDDLGCRLGGDEFVVVCPGTADFSVLEELAAKIIDAISKPIPWNDQALRCSASVGIAVDVDGTIPNQELIHNADFALYQVKRDRDHPIACFDAELHEQRASEDRLVADFALALDRKELHFVHQPILDASDPSRCKFETLARWTRTTGETVPPDVFMKFAGRLGRRAEVDLAAMRETANILGELKRQGIHARGTFNSSTDSLALIDLISSLDWERDRYDLDSDQIVIEVLETTWFGSDISDNEASRSICALRQSGYDVFLDDFGVGYAGLGHLDTLGVTGIKIDRSLISGILKDRSARIIVTSLLRLSEELGLEVVAEGIEEQEQLETLVSLGCNWHQGFGIAKPMPREELIPWLQNARKIGMATSYAHERPSPPPKAGNG